MCGTGTLAKFYTVINVVQEFGLINKQKNWWISVHKIKPDSVPNIRSDGPAIFDIRYRYVSGRTPDSTVGNPAGYRVLDRISGQFEGITISFQTKFFPKWQQNDVF
jgi:hypothetical protein